MLCLLQRGSFSLLHKKMSDQWGPRFPLLDGFSCRQVFGPEVGSPLLTGRSDMTDLWWRADGWPCATENPIQLPDTEGQWGPGNGSSGSEESLGWWPVLVILAHLSNLLFHLHLCLHLHCCPFSKLRDFFFFLMLIKKKNQNQWTPARRTRGPPLSPRQLGHPQAVLFPTVFTRF